MTIRKKVPTRVQPAVRAALLQWGRVTSPLREQPSFMIIGGQRCGTTSLFKALEEHPQVLRPPVDKGTDYYTLFYGRGPSWYRSRMPLRRHGSSGAGELQAFEACTYYMFHPFAMERIAADYPDIRLVAMLRDPIERAYSAYKHEYARGFETEPDFLAALELEDSRLDGELERMRADVTYESVAHRHHAYRRRGQFAEQLARVFEHFPREQVHTMDSEAFFAAPEREFASMLDFLELPQWRPDAFDQHNARPSSGMPAAARSFLADHYAPHDRALVELLGRTPEWLRR